MSEPMRYLLFAGDSYYPEGGWHDFVGKFRTLKACKESLPAHGCDWAHIVDLDTMKIVAYYLKPYPRGLRIRKGERKRGWHKA